MVIGVHFLDARAATFPKCAQLGCGCGIGICLGCEKHIAIVEQLGKTCARPGMLGPRQGVGWHEMHTWRDMGADLRDHIALDRAHIADSRPLRQMRRNFSRDRAHRTGRHA